MATEQAQFFREDITDSLSFARNLADARGVRAAALIDGGTRVLTFEHADEYVQRLAVYDIASGTQVLRSLVLAKGSDVPSDVAVIADPDRVLVCSRNEIGPHLQMISISEGKALGCPIYLLERFHFGTLWHMRVNRLASFRIGVFPKFRTAVAHCGIGTAASDLTAIDMTTGEHLCGPVSTQRPSRRATPWSTLDHTGLAVPEREVFITGSELGWIRSWSPRTLTMVSHWQFELPECMKRAGGHQRASAIRSMTATSDQRLLAFGTEAGSIHFFDLAAGQEVGKPLIPEGFNYTEEHYYRLPDGERPSGVTAIAYCSNDQLIVAGDEDGSRRVWATRTGKPVGDIMRTVGNNAVSQLLARSDSGTIVWMKRGCRGRGGVGIWDVTARLKSAIPADSGNQSFDGLSVTPTTESTL